MSKRKRTYSLSHILSSIIMLLALSWLTISAPFVYRAQQQQEQLAKQQPVSAEEDYNPFASTNEEKTSNGTNNFSEEYLHHAHHIEQHFTTLIKSYKLHSIDEYVAYHPEAFSPPPEV